MALAGSYWAPVTNPTEVWYWTLPGLAAPYLLLINIGFIVFWLLFRKWYFLLSLVTIIFGWNSVRNVFALGFNTGNPGEKLLKIMSYNVQNFDLYNWTENEESRDNMLQLIKDQNPDIIAFQEFYTEEDEEHFHNIKFLVNELEYKHYHFEKTLTLKEKNHWGLAVFSKYPLDNKKRIPIEGSRGNLITSCDIELPNQRQFRLFNVHLQSINFGRSDYQFFKKFDIQNPDIESSKSILKKLRGAFAKRSKQADLLATHIQSSKRPVIVCGDFNDTPMSYTYNTVRQGLRDSFLEGSFGLGGTYAGPLPSLRIDYILTDTMFSVQNFEVIGEEYSDHYPVSAILAY